MYIYIYIYLRYIYVKCNQSSRDFRNWPLRCSHIAQLASQSLHTFFASLSSYINFEAVCTTGNNMLFIHYLQCKHNMFSNHLCKKGTAIKASSSLLREEASPFWVTIFIPSLNVLAEWSLDAIVYILASWKPKSTQENTLRVATAPASKLIHVSSVNFEHNVH